MLTGITARLYLHPHPPPNSQNKSPASLPCSYPVLHTISTSSTDGASRTISLTPEDPAQPIGRSSRNKSKGLFAARNNGFFESAVMSRSHAEVRLLVPSRKASCDHSATLLLFFLPPLFYTAILGIGVLCVRHFRWRSTLGFPYLAFALTHILYGSRFLLLILSPHFQALL